MKRRIWFAALLTPFLNIHTIQAQDSPTSKWKENISFSMISEMDIAYEFSSGRLQKSEFIFRPEVVYKFNRKLKIVGLGRLYAEVSDNLAPGEPSQEAVSGLNQRLFIGDRAEAELRELYLHAKIWKTLNVRIGKQQIVWGETDGLKLLDVINPQYFREFILDDFEDSRIPLWSVKAELPIKKLKIQLVWIPDQSYHVLIDPSAPYFPQASFPEFPDGIQSTFMQVDKPNREIADSDVGIKLSTLFKGWDITANYFYHYNDFPVFNTNLVFAPSGIPSIEISPEYERLHLVGFTFNKPVKVVTLRGEVGYTLDQTFVSTDPDAPKGNVHTNQFKSAIGIDLVKGEYVVSVQLFIDYLVDDVPAFNRDRVETNVSLLLSREFMNDSFKAEALWVHSTNHEDGLDRSW